MINMVKRSRLMKGNSSKRKKRLNKEQLMKRKADANRSIVIYVPTTEFDKKISKSKIRKRVSDTVSKLNVLFGGTTRVLGTGSWTEPKSGKNIEENVIMVETMTTDKKIRELKSKLKEWISKKKNEWKQHSLSIEYEEDMWWI